MKAIKCDACASYVDGAETAFRRFLLVRDDGMSGGGVDLCAACVRAATGFVADKIWDEHEALRAIVKRAKEFEPRRPQRAQREAKSYERSA